MKKQATKAMTVLLIAAMMGIMGMQALAAGTCEFLGIDEATKGNWVGVYGEDGWILFGNEPIDHLPAYAKLEYRMQDGSAPAKHTWWDERIDREDDEVIGEYKENQSMLYCDEGKTDRIIGCNYASLHYLDIDIGNETKNISIYMLDYNSPNYLGRGTAVTVYDENGSELMATEEVYDYRSGIYFNFEASGKITIGFEDILSENAVYCGIFFDSVSGAPIEEETFAAEEIEDAPTAAAEPPPTAPQTGNGQTIMIALCIFGLSAAALALVRKPRIAKG